MCGKEEDGAGVGLYLDMLDVVPDCVGFIRSSFDPEVCGRCGRMKDDHAGSPKRVGEWEHFSMDEMVVEIADELGLTKDDVRFRLRKIFEEV